MLGRRAARALPRILAGGALSLLTSCIAVMEREPDWAGSTLSWQPLETGSDASLRGVSAPGDGVVWASGSGGTVLRSLDGGSTWERRGFDDETADLRDIEALDAQRAFAITITEPARVVATEDGGETWRTLYTSPDPRSFYDSIALVGDGAVVFGDPREGVFEVLRSADGERFEHVSAEHLPEAFEGEAAFAASGTCVVSHGTGRLWIGTGGKRARVLRSTDAGRTWEAAETPMRQGAETTGIYSVAFGSARDGMLVGGDYTRPEAAEANAAYSRDGGVTWSAPEVGPSGYRSAVAFHPWSTDVLVAVGRAGADVSLDGGRTWRTFGSQGYYAFTFAPEGQGYAVGADGRVALLRVTRRR